MAEKEGGTNTVAIVAIIVLVIIVAGFLIYFFGFKGDTTKIIEQPTEIIERSTEREKEIEIEQPTERRQEFNIDIPQNQNKNNRTNRN